MATYQSLEAYARKLVELSIENGFISSQKVAAILKVLESTKIRHIKKILEIYFKKIKAELQKEEMKVIHAGPFSADNIEKLHHHFSNYYKRKLKSKSEENKSLLGGFQVMVGDDIWDASIQGKLQTIHKQFETQ